MHPIENIIDKTMQSISQMVDVNTIIGDPVMLQDNTLVIPVSKVTFGLVAGGGQYDLKHRAEGTEQPFAGGGSSGASICPMAFLIVREGDVKLLSVQPNTPSERILDKIPTLLDALCRTLEKSEHDA